MDWQTALIEKTPNTNNRYSFIVYIFQRFYITGGKVTKVHFTNSRALCERELPVFIIILRNPESIGCVNKTMNHGINVVRVQAGDRILPYDFFTYTFVQRTG